MILFERIWGRCAQLQLFVASLAGGRWWLKASKQATIQHAYVRYVGISVIHARTPSMLQIEP